MLAECRRRGIDARSVMGKLEGREGDAETALDALRPFMEMEHAAGRNLRVGDRLAHRPHAGRGYMAGLQILLPLRGGTAEHDPGQHGLLARRIGLAFRVGALDQFRVLQHRPQPALLAQIRCAHHHQPVLGRVCAAGGKALAVAVRLRMLAVAQIAGQVRGHQDHRHVQHRHVDALALPGPFPLEQRRGQREGAHRAGRVIDRRRAELHRMHGLGPGHRHDPGGRLDHVVIGGLAAARPVLAEGGEAGVDQPRIDRRQRRVAKAERVEGAGAIVLHEDIGRGGQAADDVASLRGLQIDGDRPLVRRLGEKSRPHLAPVQLGVGAAGAALVGLARMLHLDHVRTQHA
jgi:hypothetical protein